VKKTNQSNSKTSKASGGSKRIVEETQFNDSDSEDDTISNTSKHFNHSKRIRRPNNKYY